MQNRLTTKTGAALLQDVDRLKHDAARVVQDVREHATAHVTETRQYVTGALDSARERVARNPLYVLGLGFALGLLLGLRLSGAGAPRE